MQIEVFTTDSMRYIVNFQNYDAKIFAEELNKFELKVLGFGSTAENKSLIVMLRPINTGVEDTHILQMQNVQPVEIEIEENKESESVASLNKPNALFGYVGSAVVNINQFLRFVKIHKSEQTE